MLKLRKKLKVATMAFVLTSSSAMAAAGIQVFSAADAPASRTRSAAGNTPTYRDGVYTATGQYGDQPSFVTVTVTLANGIITAVDVAPHATVPTSLELQRRFAKAVPAVVVGKPIDRVKVGRLAGSSGTPKGFNAAIQQIREQAIRRTN